MTINVLAVDDERHALNALENALKNVTTEGEYALFLDPEGALSYAQRTPIDVALLDIDLGKENGLSLAQKLKELNREINIIFVTGHQEYAKDAFDLHASGYLTKPVTAEAVERELNDLRNPLKGKTNGVRMHCFGDFEVFVNERPLVFNRPRAKEILAYLVDKKGGFADKRELSSILWETKEYTRSIQAHLHILLTHLKEVLEEAGVSDLLIKQGAHYAVDTTKFTCDYYEFEEGSSHARNCFHGEYMKNYSWAEITAGSLATEAIYEFA